MPAAIPRSAPCRTAARRRPSRWPPREWKGKDGKPAEATEWHRVVVYGPTVEAVERMLKKGDPVLVEGRLATREYKDREGVARTIAEIVVSGWQGTVNVLSGRREGSGGAPETAA